MTPSQIQAAAAALREAASTGRFIDPLREQYPQLDEASAYAIQRHNNEIRLSNGQSRTGCKIGLTSRSVQKQLGVDQPDFGMLFDTMAYGDSEPIDIAQLHQPRVEAEIAFVLDRDIVCEHPTTVETIAAIAYALPALEIVGSRIANWNIRVVDTVSDNASSCAYVLGGEPRLLRDFDIRLCGMVLERRGQPVSVGAGAACLGHPLNAVTWLARTMVRMGNPLRAGDVLLSGALGPMVAANAGDVFDARINGLGSVRACFESSGRTTQ